MVFTEFTSSRLFKAVKITAFVCLITPVSSVLAQASEQADTPSLEEMHLQHQYEWPVYAAQLSDELLASCQSKRCELNVLNSEHLSSIFTTHPLRDEVFDAFSLSEYELLISSALVHDDMESADVVLELTTSWRGVPVDEMNISLNLSQYGTLDEAASHGLDAWVERAQTDGVFKAERIYSIIGASDYHKQMSLPEKIGDFVLLETALYHDPMLGSITRYTHPDFADAVVDISVYPVSPFVHKESKGQVPLEAEMEIEKTQIQALIAQAKLEDYRISEVQRMAMDVGSEHLEGLSIEVALQTSIDPIYSTQFLFSQNDKFIKLTGNLPKHMMLALVQDSIAHIRVPAESEFMQSMRQ